MKQNMVVRIGSIAAVVGAVLAFIGNVLHPHADEAEELFRIAAAEPNWISIHLILIFAVLLILLGLSALYRFLSTGPAEPWAWFGLVTATVGVGVFMINFAIDGFVTQSVARAWVNAVGPEKDLAFQLANFYDSITYSVYTLWVILFLGLAYLLYGAAVWVSGRFPRWLGLLAFTGGGGSLVVGLLQAYSGSGGRSSLIEILFVASSTLIIVWMLLAGILMWRRAGAESQSRGTFVEHPSILQQ